MRFAAYLLNFDRDRWILKSIEMIGPYVDKIYVAWAKKPWGYNKEARDKMVNTADPERLKKSVYYDKVELVVGDWTTQHGQRNACLDLAVKDGFDYLFSFDVDEFYHEVDIETAMQFVRDNPDYDCYRTKWIVFWKDYDHVIMHSFGLVASRGPQFIVNLKRGNRFWEKRRVTGKKNIYLDIVCLHMAYVLTDEECWSKINTTAFFRKFDHKKWYNEIWLKWNEDSKNLHPRRPREWIKAIRRPDNIKLPKVLLNDDIC